MKLSRRQGPAGEPPQRLLPGHPGEAGGGLGASAPQHQHGLPRHAQPARTQQAAAQAHGRGAMRLGASPIGPQRGAGGGAAGGALAGAAPTHAHARGAGGGGWNDDDEEEEEEWGDADWAPAPVSSKPARGAPGGRDAQRGGGGSGNGRPMVGFGSGPPKKSMCRRLLQFLCVAAFALAAGAYAANAAGLLSGAGEDAEPAPKASGALKASVGTAGAGHDATTPRNSDAYGTAPARRDSDLLLEGALEDADGMDDPAIAEDTAAAAAGDVEVLASSDGPGGNDAAAAAFADGRDPVVDLGGDGSAAHHFVDDDPADVSHSDVDPTVAAAIEANPFSKRGGSAGRRKPGRRTPEPEDTDPWLGQPAAKASTRLPDKEAAEPLADDEPRELPVVAGLDDVERDNAPADNDALLHEPFEMEPDDLPPDEDPPGADEVLISGNEPEREAVTADAEAAVTLAGDEATEKDRTRRKRSRKAAPEDQPAEKKAVEEALLAEPAAEHTEAEAEAEVEAKPVQKEEKDEAAKEEAEDAAREVELPRRKRSRKAAPEDQPAETKAVEEALLAEPAAEHTEAEAEAEVEVKPVQKEEKDEAAKEEAEDAAREVELPRRKRSRKAAPEDQPAEKKAVEKALLAKPAAEHTEAEAEPMQLMDAPPTGGVAGVGVNTAAVPDAFEGEVEASATMDPPHVSARRLRLVELPAATVSEKAPGGEAAAVDSEP